MKALLDWLCIGCFLLRRVLEVGALLLVVAGGVMLLAKLAHTESKFWTPELEGYHDNRY